MSDFKVGDPYHAYGMYGRIVEIDGGIFHFSSPHGTVVKAGFLWFARESRQLTTEEDFTRLTEFEGKSLAAGVKLYGGRISVDEPTYLDLIQ